VQLVGIEGDPASEEGAEPPGLARLLEKEPVEPVPEGRRPVRLERREALDRVGGDLRGGDLLVRDDPAVGQPPEGQLLAVDPLGQDGLLLGTGDEDPKAGAEVDRAQGRVVRREREDGTARAVGTGRTSGRPSSPLAGRSATPRGQALSI